MRNLWGPEEEVKENTREVRPRRVFTPHDAMAFDGLDRLQHLETHPENHPFCEVCRACRFCDCNCGDHENWCDECDMCREEGCKEHDRCDCDGF